MAKNLIGGAGMTKIYGTGNASFEAAYMDCKAVADGIIDSESFQKADTGLVLYYMDRILEALEKQIPKKVKEIHVDEYHCPVCGSENLTSDAKIVGHNYCPECGHKLLANQ